MRRKRICAIVPALVWLLLFIFFTVARSAAHEDQADTDSISITSLLQDMVNIEKDPCYPNPLYSSKLQTSHDPRSVIPGTSSWHANNDDAGFIRYEANNGNVEKVLFDQQGPGVITRIITTGKASGATLRIYFDDDKQARVVVPAYDIAQFPLKIPDGLLYRHEHYSTTQGSSFYFPLPYAKRCKITVDDLNRNYYFHANYRTYEPGTLIKTYTPQQGAAAMAEVNRVSNLLLHPAGYTANRSYAGKKLTGPSSLTLRLPTGSKAIRSLQFHITAYNKNEYEQLMRGLIVKINFDGSETVRAPLSDFGGAGMGAPKVNSFYLAGDGLGNVTVRFIMPYRSSANVELINLTRYDARVAIEASTSDWKWDPSTLYFHATWRQERGLMTNTGLDYNNATLTGRGVFKGDVLSIYNHTKRWYGEGDEHVWIDEEKFPSHFGCGTEDYYNTTFAPIHPYFLPFGGAPREDDEASRGYNTFLRTRNLDVIPFFRRLQFEFELISWDGGTVDYSSTVYWYGDKQSQSVNPSADAEALIPLLPAIYTNDK